MLGLTEDMKLGLPLLHLSEGLGRNPVEEESSISTDQED